MKENVVMKKVKLLLLVCMCVGLSACSKENKSENDSVSQKEWLSVSEKKEYTESETGYKDGHYKK